MIEKISGRFEVTHPLHDVAATRQIEAGAACGRPAHSLMQQAGLSVAQLTLALAPHARVIWVACGPGNNGGDGFEAAMHLHQWGKTVVVTWTGARSDKAAEPSDAAASRMRALQAGVQVADRPPEHFDFAVDALLGIGATFDARRQGSGVIQRWLSHMQTQGAPRLSVDIPTGLDADTGHLNRIFAPDSIAATPGAKMARGSFDIKNAGRRHTLSLLTLKPGLFTAQGRDHAGEVWFDDLGATSMNAASGLRTPSAWLVGSDRASLHDRLRAGHASHKGSFGDVAIVGGETRSGSHMAGAALLAASAALHAGAGRVLVSLLAAPGQQAMTVSADQPELMFRDLDAINLKQTVIVCGCGGGNAVRAVLPRLLSAATQLVLDADALNAIATDPQLQALLKARNPRGSSTVLTPHPLEAGRLLECPASDIQANRLQAAMQLVERFGSTVVLKGSGTIVASPGRTSAINPTGNALLATAGTGDVLAGMIGARLAGGMGCFDAACAAVFAHGCIADEWADARPRQPMTASMLARQSLPAGF